MSNIACCDIKFIVILRLHDYCPNPNIRNKSLLLENFFKWREHDLKIQGEKLLKVVKKLGIHFLGQQLTL